MLFASIRRSCMSPVLRQHMSTSSTAPAPVVVKKGSSFGQRLAAFAVGLATGGGMGYYQLRLDVEASNEQVQDALAALRLDVVENQQHISSRLSKLERDFAQVQNA